MKSTFRSYPDSYEVVEFLIEKLNQELETLNEQKKTGIKWWSDVRYARYDEHRFIFIQQKRYLNKLMKQLEIAEHNDIQARDGAGEEVPF